MPENLIINKNSIALGEHLKVNLTIARLPTYTPIDLPVHVYRGQKKGPTLLLTGGLHGDEINGIEIIRRMIESEQIFPEIGTVIAIPIVNIYGFIQSERGLPDGKDINRSFPGAKEGSLAKLLAYTLMKDIIPHIDCGIDFHTGGASRSNYPQLRVAFSNEKAKALAESFSPPVILNSGLISKSFRNAAQKKGKPILVYETGESLRFDEFGIKEAINGTLRVMKSLGMIKHAPDNQKTLIYSKSEWVRAKTAGLFQPKVKLGSVLTKRQTLGYINDPYGDSSTRALTSRDGMVIGLNYCPVVHKGDAIIHFAYN